MPCVPKWSFRENKTDEQRDMTDLVSSSSSFLIKLGGPLKGRSEHDKSNGGMWLDPGELRNRSERARILGLLVETDRSHTSGVLSGSSPEVVKQLAKYYLRQNLRTLVRSTPSALGCRFVPLQVKMILVEAQNGGAMNLPR